MAAKIKTSDRFAASKKKKNTNANFQQITRPKNMTCNEWVENMKEVNLYCTVQIVLYSLNKVSGWRMM